MMKNFFAKNASKLCAVTTSRLTGNLEMKFVTYDLEFKLHTHTHCYWQLTLDMAKFVFELDSNEGLLDLEDRGQIQ